MVYQEVDALMSERVKVIAYSVTAWIITVFWALPFIGVVVASFEPTGAIMKGWWHFEKLTLENYQYVLSRGFARHILNSIVIVSASTVIPILVAGLAAYAFSRFSFRLRTLLFAAIVALQIVPQQMVIIPLLLLLRAVHLYDTIMGIVLVHSAFGSPWILFFLKNFIDTIPRDYEDSARVDGASDFEIFFRIVLPLMAPALASVAAIQAIWAWNDILFSIMFLLPHNWPATPAVTMFVSRYNPNWGALAAASVLSILAPLTVYVTLQKYYVRGLSGGIKG